MLLGAAGSRRTVDDAVRTLGLEVSGREAHVANLELELPVVDEPTELLWSGVDGGELLSAEGSAAGLLPDGLINKDLEINGKLFNC